jgi:formate dehydrogenase assembly factor FdhD
VSAGCPGCLVEASESSAEPCSRHDHMPKPIDASRIAALEALVAELQAVVKASNAAHTAKAAELEASLCEVRAHVRASNMQKPRGRE